MPTTWVKLIVSAALEKSHAPVQVLGGTSQNGAPRRAARRTKLDGNYRLEETSKEQGWALLFFLPTSDWTRMLSQYRTLPTFWRHLRWLTCSRSPT